MDTEKRGEVAAPTHQCPLTDEKWLSYSPEMFLSSQVAAWCPTNISLGTPILHQVRVTAARQEGLAQGWQQQPGQVPHNHAASTSLAEFIFMQQLAMASGR